MTGRRSWLRWTPRGARLAAVGAVLATALLGSLALAPDSARAQAAETVAVGTTAALGDVLVGPNGMTLYLFARDTPGVSNCSGQCAAAWPALTVDAGANPVAAAGVTGTLAVIDRADGTRQVTLDGMPLYHYSGDQAVGDTNGEKVGGVWFVIPTDTANQATYLTVQDQPLPAANQVTVRVASHDAPFYIVIHEGSADAFGGVIGATALMPPGLYTNVVVPVSRPLVDGEYVWPMLHTEDNGNGVYDTPALDLPITDAANGNADFGGVAVFRALIGEAPAAAAPAPAAAPAQAAPAPAASGNAGLVDASSRGGALAWLLVTLVVAVVAVGGARVLVRRRP